MNITIDATDALILFSEGQTDDIFIHTKLPSPVWPYSGNLSLHFKAACGTGVDFVKVHFALPVKIQKH